MSLINDNPDAARDEHIKSEVRFTLMVGVVAIAIVAGGILWGLKGESLNTQTLSLDAPAADPAIVRIEQLAGDKPAHKVENIKTVLNQDGTVTATALLTYADGRQETCNFVMVAKPAQKEGISGMEMTPTNRKCNPARKAN